MVLKKIIAGEIDAKKNLCRTKIQQVIKPYCLEALDIYEAHADKTEFLSTHFSPPRGNYFTAFRLRGEIRLRSALPLFCLFVVYH